MSARPSEGCLVMKKLHRPKVLPRGSLEGRPVGTARPISCRYRSDVNRPGRLTTPTPSRLLPREGAPGGSRSPGGRCPSPARPSPARPGPARPGPHGISPGLTAGDVLIPTREAQEEADTFTKTPPLDSQKQLAPGRPTREPPGGKPAPGKASARMLARADARAGSEGNPGTRLLLTSSPPQVPGTWSNVLLLTTWSRVQDFRHLVVAWRRV